MVPRIATSPAATPSMVVSTMAAARRYVQLDPVPEGQQPRPVAQPGCHVGQHQGGVDRVVQPLHGAYERAHQPPGVQGQDQIAPGQDGPLQRLSIGGNPRRHLVADPQPEPTRPSRRPLSSPEEAKVDRVVLSQGEPLLVGALGDEGRCRRRHAGVDEHQSPQGRQVEGGQVESPGLDGGRRQRHRAQQGQPEQPSRRQREHLASLSTGPGISDGGFPRQEDRLDNHLEEENEDADPSDSPPGSAYQGPAPPHRLPNAQILEQQHLGSRETPK